MTICPNPDELQQFLEGQLDPSQSTSMALHIDHCSTCQAACERLTQPIEGSHSDTLQANFSVSKVFFRLTKLLDSRCDGREITDKDQPLPEYIGRYRVLNLIARGAQGTLFRAFDDALKRPVAIKLMHGAFAQSKVERSRFMKEAQLNAALDDPHIVGIFEVGMTDDSIPYLVLEFVDGVTLAHFRQTHPISTDQAVRYIRQVASALQAAHRAGLIHRDVKPDNVLIDSTNGLARLTDFGLARDESTESRFTQVGTILGTPNYMSPEQITSPQKVDERSDLFSLGIMLYELLVGEPPFRGSIGALMQQIVEREPIPPRQLNEAIPQDLETLTLKLISKEPSSRFSSASELIAELDRWLSGIPILSRPVSRLEKAWRWCLRNPMQAAASCLAAVMALALLSIWFFWSVHSEQLRMKAEQNAAKALAQRNSAMQTIRELIDGLKQNLEDDRMSYDDLQKRALEISLHGLTKLRASSESGDQPDFSQAELLAIIGDLYQQLGEAGEAQHCLEQAEAALGRILHRTPSDTRALKLMVETLWNLESWVELDVAEELSSESQSVSENQPRPSSSGATDIHERSIKFARSLHEIERNHETSAMLAKSLLYAATLDYFDGLNSKAKSRLAEAEALGLDECTFAVDHPDRFLWFDLRILRLQVLLQAKTQKNLQTIGSEFQEILSLVERSDRQSHFDSEAEVRIFQTLFAWKTLADALPKPAGASTIANGSLDVQTRYAAHLKRLSDQAIKDSDRYDEVDSELSRISEFYLNAADQDAFENISQIRLDVAKARLDVQADLRAWRNQAQVYFELAEEEQLSDRPRVSIMFRYLSQAIDSYRLLFKRPETYFIDWEEYIDTLYMGCELALEYGNPNYQKWKQEALGVLHALANSELIVDADQINEYREMFDEFDKGN